MPGEKGRAGHHQGEVSTSLLQDESGSQRGLRTGRVADQDGWPAPRASTHEAATLPIEVMSGRALCRPRLPKPGTSNTTQVVPFRASACATPLV